MEATSAPQKATFTSLDSKVITTQYGRRLTVSLIRRTAGLSAAGSGISHKPEAYLVRIESGDGTFSGQGYIAITEAQAHYARLGA
jgi:hypothetical protein